MSKHPRLKVWFVDDIQENLDAFEDAHREYYDVKTFLEPIKVMQELKTETPDTLFCDLFFYDNVAQTLEIESKVNKKAVELKKFARDIDAVNDKYLAGLKLIEEVIKTYEQKFPIYAYTSKGPYILENPALDKLAEKDIPIIYKGRYSRAIERLIIERDIKDLKDRDSIRIKIARSLGKYTILCSILAWLIGNLLEYAWSNWIIL